MGIRDSNNIITLKLCMLNIVQCMNWNNYTAKIYKAYITTQHSYTLPLQSNPLGALPWEQHDGINMWSSAWYL
jgi:hypothetical protein